MTTYFKAIQQLAESGGTVGDLRKVISMDELTPAQEDYLLEEYLDERRSNEQ